VAYLGFCEGGAEPKTRGSRRRRRRWDKVWGGGVPSPLKKGSGEGAVPPPQKLKKFFFGSMCSKNFCVQAKGADIAQCPPPPKYATGSRPSVKCMCANLKISYGYFSSVMTLFIFFIIRHFRSRPQCAPPAGRPHFSRHSFGGMVRAYSDLPAVDTLNLIHKAVAVMWPFAAIFI